MLRKLIVFTLFIMHSLPYTTVVYAAELGPPPAGLKELTDVFSNIISVVVGLGFMALLVMLVWAGFKYLTSGGEPKAIQAAHQTTTWALMGILFFVVAWLVLQLIGGFTGIEVTKFKLNSLCGDSGQWCAPNPTPH